MAQSSSLPPNQRRVGKEDAMHRHFSNRGEALAEATAAKMLAGRKHSAESSSITQDGRRAITQQWFSQPADAAHRPKIKQGKKRRRNLFENLF
jgi:hypothetical protein